MNKIGVQERNKLVSSLRGNSWKENLVKGRLEAQFYPSLIKLKRVEKLISQAYIAEMLGISISSFGGIERGTRPAKPELAEKISMILEDTPSNLFTKKSRKLFAKLKEE